MVNEVKSRQGEGYDFYDYAEVAFEALGGIEETYVVGTNMNAAVQGAWLSESGLYPPSPLYLPVDAQNTLFYATQPCMVRLYSRALYAQQVAGILPAGPPVQIAIPSGVWFTLPDKWYWLQVVGSTASAGTLRVKSSG